MYKKSALAVAVAIAASIGLSACSGTSSSGGGGGDGKTLTVVTNTNEKAAIDAVVAKFKEQNPGVDVNITTGSVDQLQTTVRTQLSSGTAPDVLFIYPGSGGPMATGVVAKAGYLEDLSSRPWANNFPDGIKRVLQYEDKLYNAAVTFSGIGAIYNNAALQEAGLTAPTTWTGLLKFCSDAKAKGKTAYALAGQTNWVTQLIPYALTPTLVYGPDPAFPEKMAQGQATFADSRWTDALNKNVEMQKAGCFQDNLLGTGYEATVSMVAKGDALGFVQTNSAIDALSKEAPAGSQFNLHPFPATDNESETRMAGAVSAAYGVNARAKNKELALKFVDFLQTPEGMNLYTETNRSLPAVPNDSFTADPSVSVLQQYNEEGKTDPFMDEFWPNARVQQTHMQVIQDLLAGKTDVTSGLKQMDSAYSQGS